MQLYKLSIVTLVAFMAIEALTINSAAASEHKHEQSHAHKHETKKDQQSPANATLESMQLNQGQKWAIDTSLHTGMTRIKASMEKNINAIHDETFKAEQYSVLAKELQNHLNYLFIHCKLPSDADAQLHILLITVMQGAEQMQATSEQRQGAIKIIKALQKYPKYFKDDNWQDLVH